MAKNTTMTTPDGLVYRPSVEGQPPRSVAPGMTARMFTMVVLVLVAAYFILPIVWVVFASSKSNTDLLNTFGFWFGDDSFPEPACYAYVAPEPEGLTDQPLSPAVAQWRPSGGGHLALLRYADLRTAADPYRAAGNFFDSAYRAGAHLSTWDWHRHDSPGGVTDPLL